MRQVINKALSAIGQRKSRSQAGRGQVDAKPESEKTEVASFGMSPEDALRVGTVAGYK
ncbi:hypothetical protein [Marinobacter zhejiangensis]|uniref:Uncharacterized protein n=1 Tax=Marinobacter zhejiangensis TaxID=488535 RepID=A0A1I4NRH8_9GAMM|nr:hypothetical protein [Marinobacter zhejiangensis]SFM18101.1 hypothetical protein SAMN04487963_1570 [Marinobacter zhejiangensis]